MAEAMDSSGMPALDGRIDLHAHILPGEDDGPQTLEQALEMARIAAADGITCIAATPHNVGWAKADHRSRIRREAAALQQQCHQAGIPLCLLPGVEIYIDFDLLEQLQDGRAFPLADSRYVLLEMPHSAFPLYTEELVFHLQVKGYGVMLAHPERNALVQANPSMLAPLVERGTLVQITAASLAGQFGPLVARTAAYLLRGRLAHVIATDAHNDLRRRPELSAAVAAAGEIIGPAEAEQMVRDIPRAILAGEIITPDPPLSRVRRGKSWWVRALSGRHLSG
jgi:protein-tyrosine phosphatase